jgi:hypothetical protein
LDTKKKFTTNVWESLFHCWDIYCFQYYCNLHGNVVCKSEDS